MWLLLLFVVIGGLAILATQYAPNVKSYMAQLPAPSTPKIDVSDSDTKPLQTKNAFLKQVELAENRIKNLNTDDYTRSLSGINEGIDLLSSYAQLVDRSSKWKLNAIEQIEVDVFKVQLINTQNMLFPKFRDSFGLAIRERISQHEISAQTGGERFNTIEFTGDLFARKSNIKRFQKIMRDPVRKLRFKRAQYKHRRHARTHQVYDLSTLADTDLAIWRVRGGYLLVETSLIAPEFAAPSQTEPALVSRLKIEPAPAERVKAEPTQVEQVTAEPVPVVRVEAEPAPAERVKAEPSAPIVTATTAPSPSHARLPIPPRRPSQARLPLPRARPDRPRP
jgi:hypothetical protein